MQSRHAARKGQDFLVRHRSQAQLDSDNICVNI
jgi:hypothetical protein